MTTTSRAIRCGDASAVRENETAAAIAIVALRCDGSGGVASGERYRTEYGADRKGDQQNATTHRASKW
jgi:hypothetical protein